jgi:hypothetical protein
MERSCKRKIQINSLIENTWDYLKYFDSINKIMPNDLMEFKIDKDRSFEIGIKRSYKNKKTNTKFEEILKKIDEKVLFLLKLKEYFIQYNSFFEENNIITKIKLNEDKNPYCKFYKIKLKVTIIEISKSFMETNDNEVVFDKIDEQITDFLEKAIKMIERYSSKKVEEK